jgi:Secretion system C-terminal sorting domain
MKKLITIIILSLCIHQIHAQAWKRILKDSTYTFIDIQCTKGNILYVLYTNDLGSSFVKRSPDGGKTWKDIQLSGIQNPQRLLMRDDHVGYIIGVNGPEGRVTLVKTKDGFDNHALSSLDTAYAVMGMGFVDDSTGFYLNNEGRFRKILNGGKDYLYLANDLQRSYFEVIGSTLYLIGNGVIERSVDTGQTWATMTDTADANINAVRFCNKDTGYFLVTNGMSKGFIDVTYNGGKTFTRTNFIGGHVSVNKGLAAVCSTLDDAVNFTKDFGKTWTKENTGYNGFKTAISLKDSACYMVTSNGEIVKRFLGRAAVTGIRQIEPVKPVLALYPVPAHEKLYFELGADCNSEGLSVLLYDFSGRQVFSGTVDAQNNCIDMGHLSQGLYTVHVIKNNVITQSIPVIIQ